MGARCPAVRAGRVAVSVLLAVGLGATGCSGARPNARSTSPSTTSVTSSRPPSPSAADRSTAPQATSSAATSATPSATSPDETVDKVLLVVLENHSRQAALDGMPHLRTQAERYAVATRSYAVTHPSLPNYLAIAGGSTFGVRDDRPPSRHPLAGTSVFEQVRASGRSVRTYAEGMTRSCQTSDQGRYVVKHNPWAYFVDERAACRRFDVPAGTPSGGALRDDVRAGTLPSFGLLVPDRCNDAHDCSLEAADRWLARWLEVVEAGRDFRSGRLLVIVTFDEDDHDAGNHILTVFMHPRLRSATIGARFDQYAVSGLVSRLVGAPPLRRAGSAADLLHAVRSAMSG